MNRSWLIGAALVFSLSAIGCSDDDEDDAVAADGSVGDAGNRDAGPMFTIDGGSDASIDATTPAADAGDAGDAG